MARAILSAAGSEERLARLVRGPVSDHRDQRLFLSYSLAGGGCGVARLDPERLPVRVEGFEIHHPLEAPYGEMRELDRIDANAACSAVPQSRRGPVSVATAICEERPPAGRLSANAAAPVQVRLRVPAQELVCGRHFRPAASISCVALPVGSS